MEHLILILWNGTEPQFLRGDDLSKLMAKARKLGAGFPRRTYPLDAEHWSDLRKEFNDNWHDIYYDGPMNRVIRSQD